MNKTDSLLLEIESHNLDCVFITETWLDSTMPDSFIVQDKKFSVLRKDRNRAGGGVCILFGGKVVAVPVDILQTFCIFNFIQLSLLSM